MQDSWKQLKSDSTSWQRTLTSSPNLQNQWHVVSTLCHEENSTDPKGGIRRNTKIGLVLEVTTSYLQGKYGVEIRNESVNKDILTRGSEFLMDWTSWSQTYRQRVRRQRAGDLWDEDESTCIENGCICFCKPIKGWSKTKKTYLCLLIYCTCSWKNIDWYWTRNSIQSSVPSGKKTKHSSSAWTITSRRRWGDWIRETERWSSERIWELSFLVWWNVEEQNGRRRRQQEKISILCWLSSGQEILYLRALQSHSGRNPIDPTLQDNVVIPAKYFEYIYHIGCAVSLHSITN